jgi:hypothetical protein
MLECERNTHTTSFEKEKKFMAIVPTDQYDQRLLQLVNNERSKAGVQTVTLVEKLDAAGDTKSKNMSQANKLDHTDPITGDTFDKGISKAGYEWNTAGENIAWNQPTPEEVMQDWMNSSGHRANILQENFDHVGFGYNDGYWTQTFAAGDSAPGTYVAQTNGSYTVTKSSGEAPGSKPPTGNLPSEKPPTEETPTGETPNNPPPTGEAPSNPPPTEEVPTGEAPNNQPPTGEAPSNPPPTEEVPTGETPGNPPSTGEMPTKDPIAGDDIAEETLNKAIDDFVESIKNGSFSDATSDELTKAIKDFVTAITDDDEQTTGETPGGEPNPGEGTGQETFTVNSGKTSVFLDSNVLETAGLTITTTDAVEANTQGFPQGQPAVGFEIKPETDFTFTQENGFTPVSGTIEHSGSLTFEGVGTVGDFSIGFDASRDTDKTSGFFVADTLDTDAILFDLSDPQTANFQGENLTIADSDLLVSPELATLLGNQSLAGADIGGARIDAIAQPQNLGDTGANTNVTI